MILQYLSYIRMSGFRIHFERNDPLRNNKRVKLPTSGVEITKASQSHYSSRPPGPQVPRSGSRCLSPSLPLPLPLPPFLPLSLPLSIRLRPRTFICRGLDQSATDIALIAGKERERTPFPVTDRKRRSYFSHPLPILAPLHPEKPLTGYLTLPVAAS
jgi:hypothetical protein